MYKRSKDLFWKLQKAVNSLNEAITLVAENKEAKYMQGLKDSVIQRFEYSIELAWKFLKYYLEEEHGEIYETPKLIIKWAFKIWVIKDMDIWIDMIERRNRLSHDYHEEYANLSFNDIIDEIIDELNNFIKLIEKSYE